MSSRLPFPNQIFLKFNVNQAGFKVKPAGGTLAKVLICPPLIALLGIAARVAWFTTAPLRTIPFAVLPLVLFGLAPAPWIGGQRVAFGFEPSSAEFFETKIRPVLVEHCYECHSNAADEIGGSLWLDSADAMLSGGDSGPSIEPGDADGSILISAIKYESSEMPPDGRLPESVIDDFVRWVDAGAMDPRSKAGAVNAQAARQNAKSEIDLEKGRRFWSFQPIVDFRNQLSPAERRQIGDGSIDHLVLKRLSEAGLVPQGRATPAQQLRRLAFDLTGLPPTPDRLQRWLDQPTDQAWESVVDELLNSRAFAQHWGRHWMDLARYADSNGSDFNATFHEAWRYRDYLIDSFDQDRPLDEMIRQQVAGDLMDAASDQERYDNVVATTFLMLGAKMLSERDKSKLTLDVVDEQIHSVGQAFLGMTLGCARCHDHKFDPIPTEDYYALAGIFKSTQTLNGESQKYVSTWNRVKLPVSKQLQTEHEEHREAIRSLESRIKVAEKELADLGRPPLRGIVIDDSEAKKTGSWTDSTYSKTYIGKGYVHDDNASKGKASIEFRTRLPQGGRYQLRMAYSASGNRAKKIPLTIVAAKTHQTHVDQSVRDSSDEEPWSTIGTFEFSSDTDTVVTMRNDGTSGYVIADAIQFLPLDEEIGSEKDTESKASKDRANQEQADSIRQAKDSVDELKKELAALKKNAPEPLPVAMAPRDLSSDKIADSHVHIRGEVRNLGKVVPRGFLQVCSSGDATIDQPSGSGRLELARWLTDPDNPLVARVMVNRIWLYLFGEGIVRTPNNFGTTGEPPTHPELLDLLAIDLMRDGWRPKRMIRRIVLSETYRRSSQHDSLSSSVDAENRLLWRAHRRRITAEGIRDAMATAAGVLTMEEPSAPVANLGVLVSKNNGDSKAQTFSLDRPVRTVYLPIIRGNVDPMLTLLDAADPDRLIGKRATTNVPAQSLVLLNSEVIQKWAVQTADRILETHSSVEECIDSVYRTCLSRPATEADIELARHYMNLSDSPTFDTKERQQKEQFKDFVAAVFASTEFRLLD